MGASDFLKGVKEVPTKMYWKFLHITPEVSARWLENNIEHNRKVSQEEVNKLVQQIISGEYLPTHEGMAILANGKLGDGQHTLWAVIESGIPINRWVCFEVPEPAYEKMNKGRKRGIAESLRIERKYTDLASSFINSVAAARYRTDDVSKSFLLAFEKPINYFIDNTTSTRRKGIHALHRCMAMVRIAMAMKEKNSIIPEYVTNQFNALIARNYTEMSPVILGASKRIDEMMASGTRSSSKDTLCRAWHMFDYERRHNARVQLKDQDSILNEIKYEIGKLWPDSPLTFDEEDAKSYSSNAKRAVVNRTEKKIERLSS